MLKDKNGKPLKPGTYTCVIDSVECVINRYGQMYMKMKIKLPGNNGIFEHELQPLEGAVDPCAPDWKD